MIDDLLLQSGGSLYLSSPQAHLLHDPRALLPLIPPLQTPHDPDQSAVAAPPPAAIYRYPSPLSD
jgi:hypothetical protein